MYETKYAPKINHLRPNGIYLINKIFQINMQLDDFASNYYSRLNDGVFMILARHEGFRRAEIKEGRKVVGLWDPGFSEETMENIKTFFKSEYSELFDIIYGRK